VKNVLDLDSPLGDEEFRLLRDLIYEHCGLYFREDMRFLVERRLVPRLSALGVRDFASYYRFLRYDAGRRAELEAAAEALTTNETYFYREPHQLRAFSEEILPMLSELNRPERRLRIWSAGCSTGEEVYTLAILVKTSGLFEGWEVDIYGCDIARGVLAIARAGAYGAHAFRMPESEAIKKWFHPSGGKWVIDDAIRRFVSFGHMNLLDDRMTAIIGMVDAIFCRNVMIYFDIPARKRVLRSFLDKLHPGGFLLLGHSESLLNVTADFELVHLKNDLVYRKPRGRR
jgi:chemotaxis protein methyltransferase CheR